MIYFLIFSFGAIFGYILRPIMKANKYRVPRSDESESDKE